MDTKKVKSITAFVYDQETGEPIYKHAYTEFDINGNMIFNEEWDEENFLTQKSRSKFSDTSKILEEIIYTSDDEVSEKVTYFRADNGDLIKVEKEYLDGSTSFQQVEFDEKTNTRTFVTTDEEGEFEGKEIYSFYENNSIKEKIIINFENKTEEHFVYEYNERGYLAKQIEFEEGNRLLNTRVYKYDEKDNLIEVIVSNAKGAIMEKASYIYDDKDRIVEQKISNSYIIKYFYDDEKNCKIEERYNQVGMLYSKTEYYYDENNQLLTEITPLSQIKYSYEYFD